MIQCSRWATWIVAGLAQAVAPIAGIVLVRDLRSAKAQKEALDLYRIPSRIAGPPVPRRNTLIRARPADPTTDGREKWLIVPANHRDWRDRVIPDPGILLCPDPEAASLPRVLHRLFGGPNQRVYGVEATDRYYSAAEIHQMYGAFGHVI